MNYNESQKILNSLSFPHHIMFRMAISHLMNVGIRHLTPEIIEETCEEIMQEDDRLHIMTNEFQCELVRMAGEIAKIDHAHILTYISRNLFYDVADDGFNFMHAAELISNLIDHIEYGSDTYEDCYEELKNCGFEDSDLRYLNYSYLIPKEDDEEE